MQLPRYGLAVNLAIDPAGDLFVAMSTDIVLKVSLTLTITQISTGIYNPGGLAVDSAGNLYIDGDGQSGQGVPERINTAGVATTLVSNGLSQPFAGVADASGNLYITNTGDGTISEISPSGAITPFLSGLNRPEGITPCTTT